MVGWAVLHQVTLHIAYRDEVVIQAEMNKPFSGRVDFLRRLHLAGRGDVFQIITFPHFVSEGIVKPFVKLHSIQML